MQHHPKVSVIIPIYHSEPYLERCCRSLFSQTLDSLEYLFIIDGPSDTAEKLIIDASVEYPHRKDQIRVIHHSQNLGTSQSRQKGHDLSTGEFLYHCDSDDWLESEALGVLYTEAQETSADLVFFDYKRHYEDHGQEALYSSSYILKNEINTIDGTLCNKLIRKSLIDEHTLRFPQGINWGEDLCMSVLCQIFAEKIAYIPRVLYHYCMRQQSYTGQISRDKYMQLVTCPRYIETELEKRGVAEDYSLLVLRMKFEVKEYFLINCYLRDISFWKTLYPECHEYIFQYPSVPRYLKCISWLILHHLSWSAQFLLFLRDHINQIRY